MTKEERKAYNKAWYEANREQVIAQKKAYYQSHREERKATVKAWQESNIDKYREYQKEYQKAYIKSDVNSLGQTKQSIRMKSKRILKRMNLYIDGYEIHHCFGYEDPSKFIYISRSLHLKIHKYLREHNIDASCDHWMHIRDLVNSTDEFMYIKC